MSKRLVVRRNAEVEDVVPAGIDVSAATLAVAVERRDGVG